MLVAFVSTFRSYALERNCVTKSFSSSTSIIVLHHTAKNPISFMKSSLEEIDFAEWH